MCSPPTHPHDCTSYMSFLTFLFPHIPLQQQSPSLPCEAILYFIKIFLPHMHISLHNTLFRYGWVFLCIIKMESYHTWSSENCFSHPTLIFPRFICVVRGSCSSFIFSTLRIFILIKKKKPLIRITKEPVSSKREEGKKS